MRHIRSQITADNYAFDIVKEFTYLGWRSKAGSFLPAGATTLSNDKVNTLQDDHLYASGTWTLLKTDAAALSVLCKIFGPV